MQTPAHPAMSLRLTVLVFSLVLVCGLAVKLGLEHGAIAGHCTEYGQAQGLDFQHANAANYRKDSGVECVYRRRDGSEAVMPLSELAPFMTDLGMSFATDLEVTVPAFAVLLALLWFGAKRLARRNLPRSTDPAGAPTRARDE